MSSAHMAAQGLSVSKNFATELTHVFTVAFFFYNFFLGHLSLLVLLLH